MSYLQFVNLLLLLGTLAVSFDNDSHEFQGAMVQFRTLYYSVRGQGNSVLNGTRDLRNNEMAFSRHFESSKMWSFKVYKYKPAFSNFLKFFSQPSAEDQGNPSIYPISRAVSLIYYNEKFTIFIVPCGPLCPSRFCSFFASTYSFDSRRDCAIGDGRSTPSHSSASHSATPEPSFLSKKP